MNLYLLASIYEIRGDKDKATAIYRFMLSNNSEDALAEEALERLVSNTYYPPFHRKDIQEKLDQLRNRLEINDEPVEENLINLLFNKQSHKGIPQIVEDNNDH